MGKISLDAFLREYKVAAKQKESALENFIKKHITTDYIDFLQKDTVCTSIIKATTHVQSTDRNIVKVNSPSRYLLFIMKLIDLYTDIEIDFTDINFVKQYDELDKIGALNVLINSIPENEYAEFDTILNMKMDDFRDNEYSLTAIIYNLKESLTLSEEVINLVLEELQKQEQHYSNSDNKSMLIDGLQNVMNMAAD